MNIYAGSDHGGFPQKQRLIEELKAEGIEVRDLGPYALDSGDDYPDYAAEVARAVQRDPGARGVLFCRSGEGMEIAANKFNGIRAALVWRPDIAEETRKDNDANVLVIPSDFVADHDAAGIIRAFLATEFTAEERHARRLQKIAAFEKEQS